LRSLDPQHAQRLGELQTRLNLMMLGVNCPIANRPQNAYSNYSKPYQVKLLAEAGFEVPKSLVTNIAGEAERFYDENQRTTVIYKGASNVMTLARILTPERLPRTEYLENSPVLFQEFIAGVDYRVHVVGDQAIVTRLAGPNEDYRRSLLIEKTEVAVVPAELPAPVVKKCIAVTKQLGLAISGIDFKETADGRLVALEINPFPQFTFYEGRSGQSITQCVVDMLASAAPLPNANVFA
jgi:glutathione synthase/RimK-type ligase-like ATP-grasp enzyme